MKNELNTWKFGINNDKLIELVLKGKKTATTSIYNGKFDKIGTKSILVYDNEKMACITRIKQNIICRFKDVDWDIAKLEGENNSLIEWKEKHMNFFKTIDNSFNEDTLVLIEIFEIII